MKLFSLSSLFCFSLLLPLFSALPTNGGNNGNGEPQRNRSPIPPTAPSESLPHQLGYIAFPVVVLVIVTAIAIILLIIMYKNRYNRLCCFEKCRTNAMRRRQLASYEAKARAEIRKGDQYRVKRSEEKRKKKEMETLATMPPAYETALSHEIVVGKPTEDNSSVEDMKLDTAPLLSGN